MIELAREAKIIDRINAFLRFQATMSDSDDESIKLVQDKPRHKCKSKEKGISGKQKDKSPSDIERSDKDTKAGKGKDSGRNKRKRDLPDCLSPKSIGQHFIPDFPINSDGESRKFETEYLEKIRPRQEKKGRSPNRLRNDGNVGEISNGNLGRNTSLFSSTFCDGAVDIISSSIKELMVTVLPALLSPLSNAQIQTFV